MQCHWVIENFTHESSYGDLIKELKRQGRPLKLIRKEYKHSDLDEYRNDEQPVIFLGSIEMTELVKEQLCDCAPVAFCTAENYLCTKYVPYFGKYLFNDCYAMLPLAELQRQKSFYYRIFGKECLIFIRPDSGRKPFPARLLDIRDFDSILPSEADSADRKHQMVMVSTPKTINGEWRFVVTKEREIIAMSRYRFQGKISRIPSAPPGALKLVEELLTVGYYPDTVFCIDVCEDADGNYWLLEINSFSSAGLYECKKDLIVNRVSEIAENEWVTHRMKTRNLVQRV